MIVGLDAGEGLVHPFSSEKRALFEFEVGGKFAAIKSNLEDDKFGILCIPYARSLHQRPVLKNKTLFWNLCSPT
jgi:hypothetical protein